MKFQLFLVLVSALTVFVSAEDKKTGGWKNPPTAAPWDDKHRKKHHWWLKEWFMNKISSCPHDDSCGLFAYEMKDCDACETICTKKVFTNRDIGYVCNSQSYCPCGSHSFNLEDGDLDELDEWIQEEVEGDLYSEEEDGN